MTLFSRRGEHNARGVTGRSRGTPPCPHHPDAPRRPKSPTPPRPTTPTHTLPTSLSDPCTPRAGRGEARLAGCNFRLSGVAMDCSVRGGLVVVLCSRGEISILLLVCWSEMYVRRCVCVWRCARVVMCVAVGSSLGVVPLLCGRDPFFFF